MESHTAKHFGRYEILGELGRGSMGIVYKARDPQIDRLVAIKTISVLAQADEDAHEYRERFFLEARAAGRLSHPGIVTIFDVGEEPDSHAPYIVMECVSGKSLQKVLAEKRKLPLTTGLQVAQQLAEALDYAHSQGVVHRDMKPANILLTDAGQAKIADFGIAKLNLSQLTLNGHVLGTPAYMAPEQLEGEKIDGRADLFSLGVILYAMLTGHRPFQGNSAATVSFKVVNRDPVPATAFDAEFPPEVDYVINRAMSKNPAQRYQTGRELALDLSELLRGRVPRSKGDPGFAEGANRGPASHSFLSTLAEWTVHGPASRTVSSSQKLSRVAAAVASIGHMPGNWIIVLFILAALGFGYFSARRSPVTQDSAQASPVAIAAAAPARNLTDTPSADAKLAPAVTPETTAPKPKQKQARKVRVAQSTSETSKPATSGNTQPDSQHDSAGNSTLTLRVEGPFSLAKISVWIDEKLWLTHSLSREKKKLIFFKAGSGSQTIAAPVSAGKHMVKVQLSTPDGAYDELQSIAAEFPQNGEAVLRVHCDEHAHKLELTAQ